MKACYQLRKSFKRKDLERKEAPKDAELDPLRGCGRKKVRDIQAQTKGVAVGMENRQ